MKLASGEIKISNDVVGRIAGEAALSVDGVFSLSETLADGIEKLIKGSYHYGVKVNFKEDSVSLEVPIIVVYGYSIPDVGRKVQERVREEVEKLTGLKVEKVDVLVQGVHVSQRKKAEQRSRIEKSAPEAEK